VSEHDDRREDGAQALSYLKKFGSVTVLNGYIHQVMQKVEGLDVLPLAVWYTE